MILDRQDLPSLWDYTHGLLLIGSLVFSLILFGLIICWHEGLISALILVDKSRLCFAIGFLFFVGLVHCAIRTIYLSSQINIAFSVINKCKSKSNSLNLENEQVKVGDETIPANSLFGNYLASLKNISERTDDTINNSNTVDILIARTKGSHDIGWFLVDVLLKLGLMGTIVGFVLMLGSVANAESLNVDTMQNILQQMSLGMGTALFTTLTGLTCSLLLGLQYLVLDKGADKLIEHILEFSDTGLE